MENISFSKPLISIIIPAYNEERSLPGTLDQMAPANVHELRVAEDLLTGVQGWVLGDRNYWNLELTEQ